MSDQDNHGPHYDITARAFFVDHRRSRAERLAQGAARRAEVPLAELATAPPLEGRPDPLAILHGQESERTPQLIPLRYERMSADPFAFLRGSAAIMASDLSRVPTSGLDMQLCGDAHLANFGLFASAERTQVFDVNDFDETHPGPFDWDVRRLAASVVVAAQQNGLSDKKAVKAARLSARAYRLVLAHLSAMRTIDVWNLKVDVQYLLDSLGASELLPAMRKATNKSKRSNSDTALAKLTDVVDGKRRFLTQPPILVPVPEDAREEVIDGLIPAYDSYLRTLQPDRVALLAHYSYVDLAHKVVGVGSVGTLAIVMLLESGDGDPLILQFKQAGASVLEPYLGASRYDNHGKRVVVGQRVMQATGDPFLGWLRGGDETRHLDFYARQLHDMKGSIDVTLLTPQAFADYAQLCGATLARAHARVGDSSMVTGYLGDTEEFDHAVAEFAAAYATINQSDVDALVESRLPSEQPGATA